MSAAHGEGTGGCWGDTRIVAGLSPRGGSVPKSGPGVLRGLGGKGHPQNCSGSPGRVQRHPRKSPCVTRGVPSATSKPEGGSGWQRPSSLGTPSVPLLPSEELGTSSVPLSPGCATCPSKRHQEDVTKELAPRECRSPGGGSRWDGRVSPGDNPGPVTAWGQRGWPQGECESATLGCHRGEPPECVGGGQRGGWEWGFGVIGMEMGLSRGVGMDIVGFWGHGDGNGAGLGPWGWIGGFGMAIGVLGSWG